MNRRTCVFLVALQVCIGWHLFYEGAWKIQQRDAWSSKGYLRAATGPFALSVRWLAGDPEVTWRDGAFAVPDTTRDFLVRFQVKPFDPSIAPENRKLHQHMPAPVDEEWDEYLKRFVQHYELNDPERSDRRVRAESKLSQAKAEFVAWLTDGVIRVKPPNLRGTVDITMKTPQRLQEYREKLQEISELESGDAARVDAKATAAKIQQVRAEANAIRTGLQAELDGRTLHWQRSLYWEILTPEQRRIERGPTAPSSPNAWGRLPWLDRAMQPVFAKCGWTWPAWERVQWIDRMVQWGLVIAGIGLILGFLTRSACTIGIGLLLMFYLTMPPLPGAPESPAGHYLFINYNIIEIVALLLIAVSDPAGRYGIDAWRPFRWLRRRRPADNRSQSWPST